MTWRRTGGKPLYEPMTTQFTVACMRLSATMYYVMVTPLHTAHSTATLYLYRIRPKLAQLQCGNVYLHCRMIETSDCMRYITPLVIFANLIQSLVTLFMLLTHLPLDKMAAISQTIFADAFSSMKILYFDRQTISRRPFIDKDEL